MAISWRFDKFAARCNKKKSVSFGEPIFLCAIEKIVGANDYSPKG